MAQGILDEANPTLDLGKTTERPLGVLALKLWDTVMETSLALVNIWMTTSQQNYYWTRTEKTCKHTTHAYYPCSYCPFTNKAYLNWAKTHIQAACVVNYREIIYIHHFLNCYSCCSYSTRCCSTTSQDLFKTTESFSYFAPCSGNNLQQVMYFSEAMMSVSKVCKYYP